jgi:hypothetical protein
VCWHKFVIPAFKRLRQENLEFKGGLCYNSKISVSKKKTNKQKTPTIFILSEKVLKCIEEECP